MQQEVSRQRQLTPNTGCTTVLIGSFDPLQDTVGYGRVLIPMRRAEAAARSMLA